jgi:hypothetical protein
MTIQEMAQHLWPAWTMGLIMLYLVKNSKYADAIRVDPKGLKKFAVWMLVITLFRIITLKVLAPKGSLDGMREAVNFIPWQACLGVFWEDMCHTVPLALLGRMFKTRKWYKWLSATLLGMVMIAFGSGHLYQGLFSAILLSAYIPFTLRLGKKYGFGTVMLCHMAYDLSTILTLKWIVGS